MCEEEAEKEEEDEKEERERERRRTEKAAGVGETVRREIMCHRVGTWRGAA